MLLNLIVDILLSTHFSFIMSLVIYYFTPNNWALTTWFYVFLLVNIWDILSTYVAVYGYNYGWESETNSLIQWFAQYMNYHWAVILQTLVVFGFVIIFCVFW